MNVKVCPSCGHEIYDRGKFCTFCGCELKGGRMVTVPETKPADGETWNPESAYARQSPARLTALVVLLAALVAALVFLLAYSGAFDNANSGNWGRVNLRSGMGFEEARKQMRQAGFKEDGEVYVSREYRRAAFEPAEVYGHRTLFSVLEVSEDKDAQVVAGHVYEEPGKGSMDKQGEVFRDLKKRLTVLHGEPLEYNMDPIGYYMWNTDEARIMLCYMDRETIQLVVYYAESL